MGIPKKKKKGNKEIIAPYPNMYYTKFTKVHLAAYGSIVLCQATTIDGVTENFSWNKKSHRDLVKANMTEDVEIIVEKNVPEDKGWNYNG